MQLIQKKTCHGRYYSWKFATLTSGALKRPHISETHLCRNIATGPYRGMPLRTPGYKGLQGTRGRLFKLHSSEYRIESNRIIKSNHNTHHDEIPHPKLFLLAGQGVSKQLVYVFPRRHQLQHPSAELLHPRLQARRNVHKSGRDGLQVPVRDKRRREVEVTVELSVRELRQGHQTRARVLASNGN